MKSSFKLPKMPEGMLRGITQNFGRRVAGALGILMLDAEEVMSPALTLDEWADKTPEKVFVVFEGTSTTYREMREAVQLRARALSAEGIGWGDVVAVVMHNHLDYVTTVLALSWIGATGSLVNVSLSDAGLRNAITQTNPSAIVASRELIVAVDSALEGAESLKPLNRFYEETRPLKSIPQGDEMDRIGAWKRLSAIDRAHRSDPPKPPVRALGAELFVYIFTSGTTGLPKAGKIINARARTAALGFGYFTLGLGEDDVVYICLPLFHASGLLVGMTSVLTAGCTMALSRKFSASRFWDEIADTQSTAFVYIGEICRYLLGAPAHPRERDHRLRCMVGNGMRPDVWPAFVERFRPGMVHEFYGATEGNINMSNLFGIEGSVGRMPPLPQLDNAYLAKFDPDSEQPVRDARGRCIPCKAGEVGELLGKIDPTRVTARFDGYLGEAATNAKILRDVEKKGDAFFRSGDLMRKDMWGFYYFVDRIGDTFRWKGENVATNEVQDALGRFDAVESSNVYGVSIPGVDGRAGMAALSLNAGAHFSPQPFYEHATRALPSFAVPVFVRLLPAAEMTATFKLKKNDLQNEAFDPSKTSDLLFVRDDKRRSYEPIDQKVFDAIMSGSMRL